MDMPLTDDDEAILTRRWRRHCEMFIVAVLVVLLAFTLRIRTDQKVEFAIAPDWPAPETCLSRGLFGIDCPGCGLTRSFIYLAAGDWPASVAANRVGWLYAFAVVVQIPYRLFMLAWLSKRGLPEPVSPLTRWLFGGTLIVALIASWFFHLIGW